MSPLSLNQRIISSAIFVLILFISLTAAALNKAFIKSSHNALKNTLSSQMFALIAAADVDLIEQKASLTMPSNSPEALLGLVDSGLYVKIINPSSKILWQSDSNINAQTPDAQFIISGEQIYKRINLKTNDFLQLSYGVNWLIGTTNIPLTFIINQDLAPLNQQLKDYSETLWLWLSGMGLFLIVSQLLILKWGLSPIRNVVEELHQIENGTQEKINREYPQEIEYLSRNINQLLEKEHAQKKRYRNALGDLAHSLKTPLAVLQSSLHSDSDQQIMAEQIINMNHIVEYQLQKAATAGANNLSKAIDLSALMTRITQSLQKVYIDKNIAVEYHIDAPLNFKADEGDMMELFGNLLDNAFKWANSTIIISGQIINQTLSLSIEDDGPGFPQDLIEQLKIRGQRADQSTPGHGIGLSIVNNIVDSYSGELQIQNNSPEQGTKISIKL